MCARNKPARSWKDDMLLETMKSWQIIQLGVLFLVLAMVSVVFGGKSPTQER